MRIQSPGNRAASAVWFAAWGGVLALATSVPAANAAERYWPPVADPPTGAVHYGQWVWADLVTLDVARAAEFYASLFGWTYETYGPEDDDQQSYTLIFSKGVPIGGMVFSERHARSSRPQARWVGVVSVVDVDAAARTASQKGGKVLVAPMDTSPRGRTALLADPEGAAFAVLRSATGDPDDYLAEPGEWLWFELWADDVAAMGAFYKALAGYETATGATAAERGSGIHLTTKGVPRAGILPKPARVASTWIPYVRVGNVADTVAKARAAGGRIVIEPTSARGTTVALLVDPTGAPLALAEWPGSGEER
jgi:predicted enzyme related to lactoylglutathione lyase